MERVIVSTTDQQASTVKTLQLITIAWMSVELVVSLYAGIRACSPSLTAFGADSAIELMSAVVVLKRFSSGPDTERRAARVSGALLYLLAAYILVTAVVGILSKHLEPEPTALGIALLVAASIVMPLLGRAKKGLAVATASRALQADAAQSSICAYMSWIALAGLAVNFYIHLPWADSLAALLLLPIVVKEAQEARKGDMCGSC